MKIVLNGEPKEVQSTTLDDLLDECGLSGRVATAVNQQFVSSSERAGITLAEGDAIEVLAPMQGG
ncbi:MAG: sulfur carrier protein ThiS [Pseudomonadota bacterium]